MGVPWVDLIFALFVHDSLSFERFRQVKGKASYTQHCASEPRVLQVPSSASAWSSWWWYSVPEVYPIRALFLSIPSSWPPIRTLVCFGISPFSLSGKPPRSWFGMNMIPVTPHLPYHYVSDIPLDHPWTLIPNPLAWSFWLRFLFFVIASRVLFICMKAQVQKQKSWAWLIPRLTAWQISKIYIHTNC